MFSHYLFFSYFCNTNKNTDKQFELMNTYTFRNATKDDAGLILSFIKDLAQYEKLLDEVVADEAILREWIFDKKGAEVVFVIEDGKEVGFALYFFNFSTFVGRSGLYLEDLFILPEHRGKGYGKALLQHLAQIAVTRHCGRMEWVCLDWNQPSINFYKAKGAVPMEDWTIYRLAGDALGNFAFPEGID